MVENHYSIELVEVKNACEIISIRRIFFTANIFYGEISIQRNILTVKFSTVKFPYGEISLRRNFQSWVADRFDRTAFGLCKNVRTSMQEKQLESKCGGTGRVCTTGGNWDEWWCHGRKDIFFAWGWMSARQRTAPCSGGAAWSLVEA